MNFLVNILITALAVAFSAFIIPGIEIKSMTATLIFALVLSLLNRFVKPVLVLVTFPITLVTLGLFYILLNVFMVYMASWMVGSDFVISGFFAALFFSIVLSVVNSVLDAIAGK